jgi:hypothetical protein
VDWRNEMLIVETKVCCNRKPFESHKENCFFKQQKEEMQKFIKYLLKEFERGIK